MYKHSCRACPDLPRRALPLLALSLLVTVIASRATAQHSDWYQVELLVFTQGGEGALRQESWNPEPQLSYPQRYRFLINPQRVEQRRAQHPGLPSEISPIGLQVIGGEAPASTVTNAAPPDGGVNDPVQAPALQAFALLPSSERRFRGTAYMESQGGYNILFHETWLQPLSRRNGALSIVLDDSGADQRYPRLQGSITLFDQRYLGLETNLWLNTNGSYLPDGWQIPPPPLAPSSIEVIAEPGADADTLAGDNQNGDAGSVPYPYRHAIVLRESRRMRAGELHYIDHPVLGVAIRLTPLKDDEDEPGLEPETAATES